tara:strand:+ start:753 stop:1379 length:627 start_codon:yes stop_codon:yes gene_type:complete
MSLTKISNQSLSSITSLPATLATGALTLISTQTASSSASISFTSGLDSTYNSYIFKFINIHPATNATYFQMNLSSDGGSNYNVTKTNAAFESINTETSSTTRLLYSTTANGDLAQSTGNLSLSETIPTSTGEDDMCANGTLQLFNPSSTTFVKHFISTMQQNADGGVIYSWQRFIGGYANTTSAIDAIKFEMSSGNIDSGVIKLYGVG